MFQEISVLLLVLLAIAYVGFRIYKSVKKQKACDKCGLMEAAKAHQKN